MTKSSITATANAETADKVSYARIKSNCYLYESDALDSGIFILPESYYVKILSQGNTFHKVSYLDDGEFATAVTGYVLASSVEVVSHTPQNPYLHYTVTVTFKLSTYAIGNNVLQELKLELPFYGISTVNTKVYNYVNYNASIMAVDAKACSTVSYAKHPDSVYPTGSTSNTISTNTAQNANYIPLIVTSFIGGLCLLGLGISYFIFNNSKKQKRIQVFDEVDETDW